MRCGLCDCEVEYGFEHPYPKRGDLCNDCRDLWDWWISLPPQEQQKEKNDTAIYLLRNGAATPGEVMRLWKA